MRVSDMLRRHLPESIQSIIKFFYRLIRYSFLGKWLVSQRVYKKLKSNYLYDARRYLKYAILGEANQVQSSLRARIIMHAHCIEKGLSHPSPRLRFGQRYIDCILKDLSEYIPKFGYDLAANIGIDVLTAYCKFHQEQGIRIDVLESLLKDLTCERAEDGCGVKTGGSVSMTKEEIQSSGKIEIEQFLKSRHSIRHFDTRPVEDDLIRRAVSLAITTPSVCNRQMWKVRVFRNDRKQAILDLQSGNRGFQDEINTLLVVTCDLQCFFSIAERNEAWVDGGMFSMTLMLALHSLGLGACCLNWSVFQDKDRELRKLIELPETEVVIVFIAVGHIPERLSVARSARKPLKDVLFLE